MNIWPELAQSGPRLHNGDVSAFELHCQYLNNVRFNFKSSISKMFIHLYFIFSGFYLRVDVMDNPQSTLHYDQYTFHSILCHLLPLYNTKLDAYLSQSYKSKFYEKYYTHSQKRIKGEFWLL